MSKVDPICEKITDAAQRAAAGCDVTYKASNAAAGLINVVLGLVGLLAVVFIVMGGIQYITAAGNSSKIAKAKNTILYAVVGLIVTMLAFAIVNFVITNVDK